MRKNILILTVISAVVMVNSQNIVDDADIDVATLSLKLYLLRVAVNHHSPNQREY